MPFCSHCGYQVEENAKFCPSCGKTLKEEGPKPSLSDEVEVTACFDGVIPIDIIVDGILVGKTTKFKPAKFSLSRGAHKVSLRGPKKPIAYTKNREFTISRKASKILINVKFHLGLLWNRIVVESIIESS